MAGSSCFFFFFFFLLFSAVSPQQPRSRITRGSSLTPTRNSTWLSPSGLFAFGFYPLKNGNYVVGIFFYTIPEKTVVWTANTNSPIASNDAILQLTDEGSLVLQQGGRQDERIANPSVPIDSASMLDNGNFVLYNNNSIVWQSFDNPTDTILSGQRLSPNHDLISRASDTDYKRGFFMLAMQSDGNLVQYPVKNGYEARDAYYASNTSGAGNNVSLNLEKNGDLYLLNGSSIVKTLFDGGSIVTNLTERYPTERVIYLLRIDVDGIFRLYSHSLNRRGNWSVEWAWTEDICAANGLCGLNSFCTLVGNDAQCTCLPGFDRIQSDNRTAGCARTFPLASCGKNSVEAKYEMKAEENTVWQDNNYETSDATIEGCMKACLDDCNCEAAFFKDGQCRKQRPPLIFGRRVMSGSNYALIKVRIPTSTADTSGSSGNSSKEITKKIRLDIFGISIGLIVVAVLFMAISVIYLYRNIGAYNNIVHEEASQDEDVAPRAFSYSDLVEATNDFGEELGKGASSTVFKGILHSCQKVVAVKRLEKRCGQEKEFQTEMKIIGKKYHRNLVRLLGYSLDGPSRLLVFEYMSSGSLAGILFSPENRPSWEDRIDIARDIARGILYLHEECETQIIHCDIKSQNILMDKHGRAKISDFGIAKLLQIDQTNTYTGIRGTRGYVAPEWHRKQPITVKADVYSFGIVLLEIICCRKCINWDLSDEDAVLEEWVYNCYAAGKLENLVGDEIIDKKKLERMVKIALWSIQYEPSLRPSMKKVLLMLEGTVDIPIPPNPTSFLSST